MPNYRAMARAAAMRYGVDPDIFERQISQESGFNPKVTSSAGAEGIAQFMPSTAKTYGIDPFNPAQALDAAARYDANELKAFHGDYRKALAAYNAGAGNADKWNDPNFAHGQTYRYVRDILGTASPPKAGTAKSAPTASAAPTANSTGLGATSLGTSPQQTLAALMLAQSSATAHGQPDTGSLLAMALLRNQLGSAQQVYDTPQPASPSPAPASASGPKAATQKAPRSLLPFIGAATTGVKPSLLSSVSAAAKAAGATKIRITSGYRSPAHNSQVGGVSHSNHLTGDAIDGYGLVNGRWVPLGQLLLSNAGKFGLRSGDVAGFFNGNPDPVHVDDGANVR